MSEETVRIELVGEEIYMLEPHLEPDPPDGNIYWGVPKGLYDRYWRLRRQHDRELDEVVEQLKEHARADMLSKGVTPRI